MTQSERSVRQNDETGSGPKAAPSGITSVQADNTGTQAGDPSPPIAVDPSGHLVIDHYRLADCLVPAVLAAGRLEMDAWDDEDLCVRMKVDRTPVTDADHNAEEILVSALSEVAPDVLVVGEESSGETRAPEAGEAFFLVDPLDGTRDFIDHLPQFTVNVALIQGGRPVFGMIFAPALDMLFVTTSGQSAIMADVACRKTPKQLAAYRTQEIHTRRANPNDLRAYASRSHMDNRTADILQRIGPCERTHMGSSLKFCFIAQGLGDIYVRHGPTCEWDTAAGEAILRAAGGTVTTFGGDALEYGGGEHGYRNPAFVAWGDPHLICRFS